MALNILAMAYHAKCGPIVKEPNRESLSIREFLSVRGWKGGGSACRATD